MKNYGFNKFNKTRSFMFELSLNLLMKCARERPRALYMRNKTQ